jgi:hypothetical protein
MAQQKQMATPAYFVAFILVFVSMLNTAMSFFPFRMADARWRYGAFGIMATGLTLPIVGILLALVVAATFEHRRGQRAIGAFSLVVALVVLVSLGMFALDALQVKGQVKAPLKLNFEVATVTGTLQALLAVAALSLLGLAAFRGPKPVRVAKEQARGSGMIIGAPTPAPRASAARKPETALPDEAI